MKSYVVCTFLQPILRRVHIYIVFLLYFYTVLRDFHLVIHQACTITICFTDVEIKARSWNNLLKVPPLVRCGLRIWQSGLGSELIACHALCTLPCCSCFASRGNKGQGALWRLTLVAYRMRSHGTRRKQHLGVQLTFILLCIILVCQLQLRGESVILAFWHRGITTSNRKTGGALPMYFEYPSQSPWR